MNSKTLTASLLASAMILSTTSGAFAASHAAAAPNMAQVHMGHVDTA